MGRTVLHLGLLLLMCACFSCRMIRVIEIQSYNPAPITFPSNINTVMIIDNSAQQPDNVGHRYWSMTNHDSIIAVSADSTAYLFCTSLGKAIAESPLFEDIRICDDTLRRDSLFFKIQPFTRDEVESICEEYGTDALITLDKLNFQTTLYTLNLRNNTGENSISVEISGELRALWPGQPNLYVFPFSDTLIWSASDEYYFPMLASFTPSDVKEAMRYFSEYMGYKTHTFFVPHWSEEKRWFYRSFSSEWRRATAFASAKRWEEAAKIWTPMYEKTTHWKQKSQLASNLALCYEISGDFSKALEYAQVAYNLLAEHTDEKDVYRLIQQAYLSNLKKREETDHTLSEQLREK